MNTTITTPEQNAATVTSMYEAFGRGDVDAILACLDPDIAWEQIDPPTAAQEAGVPYLLARQGREAVAGFFAAMRETLEYDEFTVDNIVASGNTVVSEITLQGRSKATGRSLRDHDVHVWKFGSDGLAIALRHAVDTAKHIAIHAA